MNELDKELLRIGANLLGVSEGRVLEEIARRRNAARLRVERNNERYDDALNSMTAEQRAEFDRRKARGYRENKVFTDRRSRRVAVMMTLNNEFGRFLIVVYPDGSVEGGKMSSIKLRKSF